MLTLVAFPSQLLSRHFTGLIRCYTTNIQLRSDLTIVLDNGQGKSFIERRRGRGTRLAALKFTAKLTRDCSVVLKVLFSKAANAEFKGNYDVAISHYLQAGQMFLNLMKRADEEHAKGVCRKGVEKCMKRAEEIRAVKKDLKPVVVNPFDEGMCRFLSACLRYELIVRHQGNSSVCWRIRRKSTGLGSRPGKVILNSATHKQLSAFLKISCSHTTKFTQK